MSTKQDRIAQAQKISNKVEFKCKTQLMKLKKPRRGKKKRLNTKNPFIIKNYDHLVLEAYHRQKRPIKMDGFYLMKVSKCEFPHEVIKLNLCGKNIHEIVNEDLKFFNNLIDLDLSENRVNFDQITNLKELVVLSMQDNQIKDVLIKKEEFPCLQMLDISYNQVNFQSIGNLTNLDNVQYYFSFTINYFRVLNLAGNYLEDLPPNLENFKKLEFLDLSSNEFRSSQKSTILWQALASIKNLKHLNVARNYLRGIHTEKLSAGDFYKLEHLDFGYNSCENQHNLICARNFKELKVLVITGNPFGIMKQFKGLEMELYARTGCVIVNKDVERPYLKKPKTKKRLKIVYTNLITLKEQYVDTKPTQEFFGVDLPAVQDQVSQREEDEPSDVEVEDEPEEKTEEKDSLFFITQAEQTKRKQAEKSLVVKNGVTGLYDFMQLSKQALGDEMNYQNQKLNLQSAYKLLKNYVKRSGVYVDKTSGQQAPHYLMSTVAQPRFKFTSIIPIIFNNFKENAQRELQKANKKAKRDVLMQKANKATDLKRIEDIIDLQFSKILEEKQ